MPGDIAGLPGLAGYVAVKETAELRPPAFDLPLFLVNLAEILIGEVDFIGTA
jgi:hypothetical protein